MIYNNGLAPDTRTDEEKAKDYPHSELYGDVVINWIEKTPDQWKKYTPREQDGSLSCCAQASAKAVEILLGNIMSAHPPYRSRINYPSGGMFLQNVGQVWKTPGSTLESLDKSQFQNEAQMNRGITVETPTKIQGYVFPNYQKIDEIAQAIELHKHCMLIVHCSHTEWTAKPVFNGAEIDFGHCICAIDYFIQNGVKTLLIEDSTGHFNSLPPNDGQRLITEDFLLKRFVGAMYLTLEAPIPKHVFYKTLKLGMRDPEVKELQKVLGVIQTGYFGTLTLQAVETFQAKHALVIDGIVGPNTNKALNAI